jgi:hypothetical protein
MKVIFLCGGARARCLRALIQDGTVQLAAVITPQFTEAYGDSLKQVMATAGRCQIPVFSISSMMRKTSRVEGGVCEDD